MTPDDIKLQVELHQARELMADKVRDLRDQAPAFLVALCDAIQTQDGLRDLPHTSVIVLPVLAFRMLAQLAAVALADVDGILRRRKDDI